MAERAKPGDVFYPRGRSRGGKDGLLPRGSRRDSVSTSRSTARPLPLFRSMRAAECPSIIFDVYRIGDPEEMDEIGFDDYIYGGRPVPDRVGGPDREILPEKRVAIRIEKDLEKGFDYRRITIQEEVDK